MNAGREIPLRARDGSVRAVARVDDADYERVARLRWCLSAAGYAERRSRTDDVRYIHRFVLGLVPGDGREVDHRNGDRLDNRRSNLRLVSRREQMQNRPRRNRANRSGYRGVHFDAERRKWAAQAKLNYRSTHLGRYDTAEEAAEAAARFRREHMPFSIDAELQEA